MYIIYVELIYNYEQEKKQSKNKSNFYLELKLYKDINIIKYNSIFHFEYTNHLEKKFVVYNYTLEIDLKTGNFKTTYGFDNQVNVNKTFEVKKINNFLHLEQLIIDGFSKGERNLSFWGLKYEKAKQEIINKLKKELNFNFNYNKIKKYNDFYVLVVDFFLYKNNIKYHDNVYYHIKYDLPNKKWLKKNNNNYLPSVLDSYGIKSKYFITELNVNCDNLSITSLNYLCKLFGNNYIDYIKKFNWKRYCLNNVLNKKIHKLKNEYEKKSLTKVLKDFEKDNTTELNLCIVNNLFEIRKYLEKQNIFLDFKAKTNAEFDYVTELWMGSKLHLSRGHKLRYNYCQKFINDVEEDIIINDKIFNIKVLRTEDDFRIEGYIMKNCLTKQFSYGAIYIFIVMKCGNKRINIKYNKNKFMESYGKANTLSSVIFDDGINELNNRMCKYKDLQWDRESYDYVKR